MTFDQMAVRLETLDDGDKRYTIVCLPSMLVFLAGACMIAAADRYMPTARAARLKEIAEHFLRHLETADPALAASLIDPNEEVLREVVRRLYGR